MSLFSAAQIRECEAATLKAQKISSWELMERAAGACRDWILQNFPNKQQAFLVLSGMGNNGGDGLALARLLLAEGYPVYTVILRVGKQFSPETSLNFKYLHEKAPDSCSILEEGGTLQGLEENLILIDALFGIGLNRPIRGWIGDFIHLINKLPNRVIAIDMPSGLCADRIFNDSKAAIVEADDTLTFQFFKRSLMHPEGATFSGRISILDIGLEAHYLQKSSVLFQLLTEAKAASLLKTRSPFGHKGSFGTLHLIGGSYGMMGAMAMAGVAALRSGVGKVFLQAPSCGYNILQTLCPEAMFIEVGTRQIEGIIVPDGHATVGIGPGMGQERVTAKALEDFLRVVKQPLVVDADALNLLAKQKHLLRLLPANSILTPHPGEFVRLFGASSNSMLQLELAREKAMQLELIIVLKGHYTQIITPDGLIYYNLTGNTALAKGGSGDVLTGLIAGLLAQKYSSEAAACLGVWLHGRAADLALLECEEETEETLTPMNLGLHFLASAFSNLKTLIEGGKAT